jgi:hypothetical protein
MASTAPVDVPPQTHTHEHPHTHAHEHKHAPLGGKYDGEMFSS